MSIKETFFVNGENLLKKIKEIIAEGNVTKISISDKNGKEIMSFPVTIGVVGMVFAPIFAAVGAMAALLTECKITVEKRTTDKSPTSPSSKDQESKDEDGTSIEVK
ncbi:DUF4342 domain-containing protein [Sphingobacterium sp. UT-1RO-CII-1]|uniref:DUF4342 domain-containing protein n=1 Tax=Sphingobacterium sp. UT-1RO-CII-1 TaxID=2995225 RepID=UPI00227AF987|nr:DUF4342 domain-containing protein [Sphingobacterium sp. UT-1RO-CII-1]MCY4781296.1 DUF4342 domain-containing protein [Sphingobacterium sp. UT-1RO-CII-1]